MNVIFTCGGTGGHINPAIAVAKMLQERKKDANILFIGSYDGMETELVPREGFRLETLWADSFSRKLTPAGIWHNLKAAVHLNKSMRRAKKIIKEFKPDVILGTGGYASYPMLKAGAKKKIPTAVHEANAVPGLTTRMVADQVDKILVAFEESRDQYKNRDRVVAVGMPVRQEFFYTKREDARNTLHLDGKPLIVSAWGSLGAREMNKIIAEFMHLECEDGEPFRHIHATGSYGWKWMPDYVSKMGVQLEAHPDVTMQEYIYNMPEMMAAADLVFSRAGSSSLNEIAAAGTPCIIVPSPNVTDNHQEKNARILEKRGAAVVIEEKNCTGETLYQTAKKLLGDPERCKAMRKALHAASVVDSTERILGILLELAEKK
ncbi:MAG: UDP-N-acetylglucosamine--N-acetylmuramyl-(pentapeptide) pyrophosphoryl-undecaprenol N-acetylglucosamine transferase [Clostridia bacterium]|nr:UDP-N-acetylglucosamine--N-acetylmuramyl-(pentapeptide) pyrophosphoryl-undecaprenol N-acetylglucosamine transferase [Clostridia bacterium]